VLDKSAIGSRSVPEMPLPDNAAICVARQGIQLTATEMRSGCRPAHDLTGSRRPPICAVPRALTWSVLGAASLGTGQRLQLRAEQRRYLASGQAGDPVVDRAETCVAVKAANCVVLSSAICEPARH